MIKLSDFVCKFMESKGITTIFTLTGGGIMHLVESVGNSNMEYVCCHHEQACSIAAQAFAMHKNDLGVCLVTTGPGGTNAITGVAAAYVDSTPLLCITGQVKRDDFASLRKVRQFGAQENDIISMVKPITKYSKLVTEPEDILYCLEKAVYFALTGRRGPVWLDIPLDIQSAMIEEDKLRHYNPKKDTEELNSRNLKQEVSKTLELIKESKRPLILAGHGVVASEAENELYKLVSATGIPVMGTWRALSLFNSEDPIFMGSPGLQAPRFSNIIMQGCDLLIILGSRVDNMITAFNEKHFAFRAKKIIVDIDENEVNKLDMPNKMAVIADVKEFMMELVNALDDNCILNIKPWVEECRILKERFPILKENQPAKDGVDLYQLTSKVSEYCVPKDTIVISSTSRCNTAGHIAFHHQKGQKTISSMGMGSMGFALPSAVGAYYANNKQRVIVIEGDGSFQLNLQELQTINQYGVNVKIFIFDNNGYAAITTMQERNFNGHYVGSNMGSGVSMPDFKKLSYAYGIHYICINNNDEIESCVKEAMEYDGTVICDAIGSLMFDEIPKCISSVEADGKRVSASLENPYPFLSDTELAEIYNKIIHEEV